MTIACDKTDAAARRRDIDRAVLKAKRRLVIKHDASGLLQKARPKPRLAPISPRADVQSRSASKDAPSITTPGPTEPEVNIVIASDLEGPSETSAQDDVFILDKHLQRASVATEVRNSILATYASVNPFRLEEEVQISSAGSDSDSGEVAQQLLTDDQGQHAQEVSTDYTSVPSTRSPSSAKVAKSPNDRTKRLEKRRKRKSKKKSYVETPKIEQLIGHSWELDATDELRKRIYDAFERHAQNGLVLPSRVSEPLADAGFATMSSDEVRSRYLLLKSLGEDPLTLADFEILATKVREKLKDAMRARLGLHEDADCQSAAIKGIVGLGAMCGSPTAYRLRQLLPEKCNPEEAIEMALKLREQVAAAQRAREADVALQCGLKGKEFEAVRPDLQHLLNSFRMLDTNNSQGIPRSSLELWLLDVGSSLDIIFEMNLDALYAGGELNFQHCLLILQRVNAVEREAHREQIVKKGLPSGFDGVGRVKLFQQLGITPRTKAEQQEMAALLEGLDSLTNASPSTCASLAQRALQRLRRNRLSEAAMEADEIGLDRKTYLKLIWAISVSGEIKKGIPSCGVGQMRRIIALAGLKVDSDAVINQARLNDLSSVDVPQFLELLREVWGT